MKNPNGFGTVTKLSGKRRKPWIAKVTIGFDEMTGKQIQKSIGTFITRPEALQALCSYNASKENERMDKYVNVDSVYNRQNKVRIKHTFKECALAYIENEKEGKSRQWLEGKTAFLKLLSDLHDENIATLDLFTIQKCFDKIRADGKSLSTLRGCKTVCSKTFEYAVIHKYINQNDDYTKYIKAVSDAERSVVHRPFTREEISILIDDGTLPSKMLLVYILTGCRAMELTNVQKFDGYIRCGSKTKSGKNRNIPIHSYIEPFIDEVLERLDGLSYQNIRTLFQEHMKKLNMNHTTHDTRYTFATLGKEASMTPTVIKKIMGHTLGDITEDVYTHESIDFYRTEIEKIKIS